MTRIRYRENADLHGFFCFILLKKSAFFRVFAITNPYHPRYIYLVNQQFIYPFPGANGNFNDLK